MASKNKKVGIWQTVARSYNEGVGWSDNYPHGGPNEYSYTSSFIDYRAKTAGEAIDNLVQPTMSFSNVITNPKIMTNLDDTIAKARKQELTYLKNHKFKLNNQASWGQIITGINEILSTSEIFERNLQLLKQYVSHTNDTKEYRDITSLFGEYIQTAANQVIPKINGQVANMSAKDFNDLTEKIIKLALKNLFSETDYVDKNGNIHTHTSIADRETMKALQAYGVLVQHINKMVNADFLQDVSKILHLRDFFIKTQETYQYNQRNNLKKGQEGYRKQPKIYSRAQKGSMTGTVGETLRAGMNALLGGYSQTTHGGLIDLSLKVGQGGAKADRLQAHFTLTQTNAKVDFGLAGNSSGDNNSAVVNSIENFEELMQQLDLAGAKGELVVISDKSYLINKNFEIGWEKGENGGFSAQEATTLSNIGDILEKVKSPVDPTELIDFLSNCGDDMILGNQQDDVMHALATQIGAFLFNSVHVSFHIPTGINMIHVLYLSGVYVPLSIILEGIKKALYGALNNFSVESFVTVNFYNGETVPKPWKTEQEWIDFRQKRIDDTKLKIRFLEDFAQFIVDAINGAI